MQDTFVTIARYTYSSEAQIIKGRLEAEGIEVFLRDNITIDTDPLVSNAIGGVKLKVLAKDEAYAREIVNSIKNYSIDDEGNLIKCPNCNNEKIELYSTINDFKSFFFFLIGFISGTLPFTSRYEYKCSECNTQFPAK